MSSRISVSISDEEHKNLKELGLSPSGLMQEAIEREQLKQNVFFIYKSNLAIKHQIDEILGMEEKP
ncbi:MAG: hypothetical protein UY48_C0011G0047 [Candidatus Gottesmanbacteria bacterium GW2011_GWB1_49_7]|uniref:Uncharacterized protein n=1 Tax=Candidatus Gottesmanbacteria bacterium GW2011_GWB1_49_7 TaxID=1618448 RepID=A0A0G1W222_9BACT|nr:MAG: hypothetical protein UY48_C0011G0047 [Candidatus Gottesmanbacteria bacterium GW2011_GWB1_49_7]